jgi:hypothetical protein
MESCSNMPTVSSIRRETNERIYVRNLASEPLQPYLDIRPAPTKYSFLPVIEPRKKPNIPLIQQPVYSSEKVFNPGNRQAPWSGYASNVNKESELRNQIYALQKCSQAVYVPNSNSDLYNFRFNNDSSMQNQTHSLLFKEEKFEQCTTNPYPDIIGVNLFMNPTRVQLKSVTKPSA